jgi:LPS-assembly lipoprotein
MSWFDRIRAVAVLAALVGLGGCFQPLYGEASHPGLTEDMRAVEVAPIPDRIGHYLGDDLVSRMNGSGETPPPKYRLTVKLSQSTNAPTIESQIGTADAATVIGQAKFDLIRIENGALIYTGSATATAVYDRFSQSYANLRAARDAEIRIARELADEIALRVGAALSEKK